MTTEEKIFDVAYENFLLYGYHGTTISKIASAAGVNKTLIHYYFRSKDKLYQDVVVKIAEILFNNEFVEHQELFLFVIKELQNNKELFLKGLNTFLRVDWNARLILLIKNTITETSLREFVKVLLK